MTPRKAPTPPVCSQEKLPSFGGSLVGDANGKSELFVLNQGKVGLASFKGTGHTLPCALDSQLIHFLAQGCPPQSNIRPDLQRSPRHILHLRGNHFWEGYGTTLTTSFLLAQLRARVITAAFLVRDPGEHTANPGQNPMGNRGFPDFIPRTRRVPCVSQGHGDSAPIQRLMLGLTAHFSII